MLAVLVLGLFIPSRSFAQERVVRSLKFEGNKSITDLVLRASIVTTQSSWFARSALVRWLGLGSKRRFSEREFREDLIRIRVLYALHGFPEAKVDTVVRRTDNAVHARVIIEEGAPVVLTRMDIRGLDSVVSRRNLRDDLPLRVGNPYNPNLLLATGDTLQNRLRDLGYPTPSISASPAVDRPGRKAEVDVVVDPGETARIGSISVKKNGGNEVDSTFVLALLTTRRGRLYRQRDLYESQINLYRSGLFRFASVMVDTMAFTIGDPEVPILVTVQEGGLHRVRAGVGYGTNDCFRMSAGWTARNVAGRGQEFDVYGVLSKIGVGNASPFGLGLEDNWICGTLAEDSIGSRQLNYSLTTSFRRPAFLSPSNSITLALFAERRSEFKVYQREEIGSSLTLTRETIRRIPITLTYRVSYGATQADAVSFCSVFNACLQQDIDRLSERRLLATLTATASHRDVLRPVDPLSGHVYQGEIVHSSRVIGSSKFAQFTRVGAAATSYWHLGEGIVLAGQVRGGLVFAPELTIGRAAGNFVPPEQRFYAGGANDVRGYDRNQLGPVVYVVPSQFVDTVAEEPTDHRQVRLSPTGGNTMVVGGLELRLPSPVLASRLRWAAFVDAGGVWERGGALGSGAGIKFTPGIGLRFTTPLGPARLDVAYNGYQLPRGALYSADAVTRSLTLVRSDYRRPATRLDRFNFQFSVGYPF